MHSDQESTLLLDQQGVKTRDIASKIGVDPSTIHRQLHKLHQNPDPYYVTPGRGRKHLLDERDLRCAARAITSGNMPNATALQRDMFPHVSERTVRRDLCSISLNGRFCRRKPLLDKKHKKRRKQWVEEHADQNWKVVIFSDESKFNLVGSDGHHYCQRRSGEEYLDPKGGETRWRKPHGVGVPDLNRYRPPPSHSRHSGCSPILRNTQ